MNDFKIEKDIPLPPKHGTVLEKYPFKDMKVNDSFFVKRGPNEKAKRVYGRMASATSHARKKLGYRFAMRQVSENGVSGVRIWRISGEEADAATAGYQR